MIIWGWLKRPIVLGLKADLCQKCATATPHAVVRMTHWAHVFWVPFLLLWVGNRLVCTECGTERKLGWGQTRRALATGKLPMPARPGFKEWGFKAFEESGRMPQETDFEPLDVNPKRGPWDLYLKAWPVLVAGVLAFAVLNSTGFLRQAPPPAANAPTYAAHDCWQAADGTINGCKLSNGVMTGEAVGSPVTCYFAEPLLPDQRLYCQ